MTRPLIVYMSIAVATVAACAWLLLSRVDPPATTTPPRSTSPAAAPPAAAPRIEPARTPAPAAAAQPATAGPATTAGVASHTMPAGAAPPPLTAIQPAAPAASPYPSGLSSSEERALRVRHLVELRELVATADARIAAGDDDGGKLASFRDEEAARLAGLETWAREHDVTETELTRATDQLARLRATAVVEPPRPR